MGGIGDIKFTGSAFVDISRQNLQSRAAVSLAPKLADQPALGLNSFDNKAGFSDFLVTFKARLQKFQSRLASSSFLADDFSHFIRTARVSDTDKVLAKPAPAARQDTYNVGISRLAAQRSARSATLSSSQITDLSAGTYAFTLQVGGASYALSVDIDKTVSSPDRNLDVLRKIKSAISGVDDNIEAQVSRFSRKKYDAFAGIIYEQAAYLSVNNKATGKDLEFSLSDSSGDLISKLGLDKIRNVGRRSSYSIDGVRAESELNSVGLDDNNLTARFMDTTVDKGRVQIKVGEGIANLDLELNDIISDYNKLLTWLDDNRRYVSPDAKTVLFKDIGGETAALSLLAKKDGGPEFRVGGGTSMAAKLAEIGLGLNGDGNLSVEDGFTAALDRNIKAVYDAMAGEDGFFTKIATGLADILAENGDRFILTRSNYLNYDASGADKQSITRQGVSNFLNLYI